MGAQERAAVVMTEKRSARHTMTITVKTISPAGEVTEISREEVQGDWRDVTSLSNCLPPCQCPSPNCPDRRRR